jgi:hypothetical protein
MSSLRKKRRLEYRLLRVLILTRLRFPKTQWNATKSAQGLRKLIRSKWRDAKVTKKIHLTLWTSPLLTTKMPKMDPFIPSSITSAILQCKYTTKILGQTNQLPSLKMYGNSARLLKNISPSKLLQGVFPSQVVNPRMLSLWAKLLLKRARFKTAMKTREMMFGKQSCGLSSSTPSSTMTRPRLRNSS